MSPTIGASQLENVHDSVSNKRLQMLGIPFLPIEHNGAVRPRSCQQQGDAESELNVVYQLSKKMFTAKL